jgi:hypothetical protein
LVVVLSSDTASNRMARICSCCSRTNTWSRRRLSLDPKHQRPRASRTQIHPVESPCGRRSGRL